MRVLVTGAAGFLGAHVASALGARGADVVAVSQAGLEGLPGRNVHDQALGAQDVVHV